MELTKEIPVPADTAEPTSASTPKAASYSESSGVPIMETKTSAAAKTTATKTAATSSDNKKLAALGDAVVGPCKVHLIPEYGVIHLKGALSETGQKNLWNLVKPVVEDPKGKGAGFSTFNFHKKRSRKPRKYPDIDRYGYLLFHLAAKGLMSDSSGVDLVGEPSYKHLADISSDKVPVQLDDTWMLCYRSDARLNNHIDCDSVLFTMSVALGDDCEFIIGKKTGRARYGERCHHGTRTIRMRSGDAIFFDGGSVPHCVNRVIEGSAPSWWGKAKVPTGSRCVLLFREKETSRNGRFCPADIKKKKKTQKKKTRTGGARKK